MAKQPKRNPRSPSRCGRQRGCCCPTHVNGHAWPHGPALSMHSLCTLVPKVPAPAHESDQLVGREVLDFLSGFFKDPWHCRFPLAIS